MSEDDTLLVKHRLPEPVACFKVQSYSAHSGDIGPGQIWFSDGVKYGADRDSLTLGAVEFASLYPVTHHFRFSGSYGPQVCKMFLERARTLESGGVPPPIKLHQVYICCGN